MDDRFAYALNTLWSKNYDLGRIIRFRQVTRGRQAEAREILTAEQNEYTAYLYPPTFDRGQLATACAALEKFDSERFSIVPMVQARDEQWVADGPQHAHLAVGLQTSGQMMPPDEWTLHDVSQLGLRLAWLHRMAAEQLEPGAVPSAFQQLHQALTGEGPPLAAQAVARLPGPALTRLREELADIEPARLFVHGDVQPAAFLLNPDRQIVTVVDWALLHQGDPLEDVIDAFCHWCIGADGVVNADLGRVLIESYRSLRPFEGDPWPEAVVLWCGQHVVDAAAGRRPLPRKFGGYLEDPASLAGALQMCAAR